ncbi:MAG TPA: hypothetical protein PK014_03740 [Thermoanaerobaculia bacterium]|nr:hypothetical protein [Thermoanaerobaculia bacterium]HUM29112.1 hypothetical protein [Thermoanaerobaculia bacterium]HXK67489.1 hypothetical protein [Thermoanaerobaculia bacterium]
MTPPLWTLLFYQGVMYGSAVVTLLTLVLRSRNVSLWLGRATAVMILALWAIRWWIAGHLPMFGAYESALSLCAFGGAILLVMDYYARRPYLAVFPPVAAVLLFHGSRYSSNLWALTISERGFWVHIHALAAFVTFGVALVVLADAVMLLSRREFPLRRDLLALFCMDSLMIISGSFYRFLLFGKAWSFDPIESMNLAVWLALATLIHMGTFRQWSSRKMALWALFVLVLLVLAYRLILIFPAWSSYHILDIDLRMHILPK